MRSSMASATKVPGRSLRHDGAFRYLSALHALTVLIADPRALTPQLYLKSSSPFSIGQLLLHIVTVVNVLKCISGIVTR